MGVLNTQVQRRKWNRNEMCLWKYIREPETAWKTCYVEHNLFRLAGFTILGNLRGPTRCLTASSPESLLLLRQELVVSLWLNILCLLVECVLLSVCSDSSVFCSKCSQVCLHHRDFSVLSLSCWWALMKLTWVTFHPSTAHLGTSSQASTVFILAGASTCTVA